MGLEEQMQEEEIEGVRYEAWPLPFSAARGILLKVSRALGAAAGAVDGTSTQQVGAILSSLSDKDIAQISEAFGNASRYHDGTNMVPLIASAQELHFAGRFDSFVRWIVLCVRVNFSGFIDGARRARIAADIAKLATPTPSTD